MATLLPLAFGLGGPEILFLGGTLFIALPFFVFWLWMLIDCLTQETDPTQKLIWVLVIIFASFVGAPLYLFIRKIPRGRAAPANR
ncbi:PLD nuclease N-terminal domain-containing protein [Actomonas aquatica]|uniref:PLD nuclease N-terminal domain-containing protein n=1 Tax=Actomonas aquatica TaxID=2866162 RepID=A0ABZ1CE21_9BACT|nr:PLD nuclease N-terminal domain-containing protein [Opitutus sp. WL0086]WRQ89542.1 PLD nuclease N-terminal domain-containing protein [Opitutus sp. WL0086]